MPTNTIPDGLTEIAAELPLIMKMIARSSRWVHPDVFRALPVWRPDTARNQTLYKSDWVTPSTNKGGSKVEGNTNAQTSLMSALGIVGKKPPNWTTCHIWAYDDGAFVGRSRIVQDRRYFSCIGNMVLLPTPLKGFTDAVPSIKRQLRVCAYHLYGWACEHEDAAAEAELVRSGDIPGGYPEEWPTGTRKTLPPGTGPFNDVIKTKIAARKRQIAHLLKTTTYSQYPREAVRDVLAFWKIELAG